ncbi:hypothetical protein CRENBAI_005978 [Crenichthys baileyi]|uniref:Uncharacterized protein n=1 Tax=Crenichthys baileyi TaxID=28760 RepID=A0AAV9SJL0_9TELE
MGGSRSVRGCQHPSGGHTVRRSEARRRMPNLPLQLRQQVLALTGEPPMAPLSSRLGEQPGTRNPQGPTGGPTNRNLQGQATSLGGVESGAKSKGEMGGKAYSRPTGHTFARASIPSGELASAGGKTHKGQMGVLLLEEKKVNLSPAEPIPYLPGPLRMQPPIPGGEPLWGQIIGHRVPPRPR